eukprot:403373205
MIKLKLKNVMTLSNPKKIVKYKNSKSLIIFQIKGDNWSIIVILIKICNSNKKMKEKIAQVKIKVKNNKNKIKIAISLVNWENILNFESSNSIITYHGSTQHNVNENSLNIRVKANVAKLNAPIKTQHQNKNLQQVKLSQKESTLKTSSDNNNFEFSDSNKNQSSSSFQSISQSKLDKLRSSSTTYQLLYGKSDSQFSSVTSNKTIVPDQDRTNLVDGTHSQDDSSQISRSSFYDAVSEVNNNQKMIKDRNQGQSTFKGIFDKKQGKEVQGKNNRQVLGHEISVLPFEDDTIKTKSVFKKIIDLKLKHHRKELKQRNLSKSMKYKRQRTRSARNLVSINDYARGQNIALDFQNPILKKQSTTNEIMNKQKLDEKIFQEFKHKRLSFSRQYTSLVKEMRNQTIHGTNNAEASKKQDTISSYSSYMDGDSGIPLRIDGKHKYRRYIEHLKQKSAMLLLYRAILAFLVVFMLQINNEILVGNHYVYDMSTFVIKSFATFMTICEIILIIQIVYQQGMDCLYTWDMICACFSLFRLHIFINLIPLNSRYNRPQAKRLCDQNGTKARSKFAWKAMMKRYPYMMLICAICVSVVFFGVILRNLERANLDRNGKFDYIWDSFWMIIILMLTIGYGDITIDTNPGRIIGIFACLWGQVIYSLFIVSMNVAIKQDESDARAYQIFKRNEGMSKLKKTSSAIIGNFILYSHFNRKRESLISITKKNITAIRNTEGTLTQQNLDQSTLQNIKNPNQNEEFFLNKVDQIMDINENRKDCTSKSKVLSFQLNNFARMVLEFGSRSEIFDIDALEGNKFMSLDQMNEFISTYQQYLEQNKEQKSSSLKTMGSKLTLIDINKKHNSQLNQIKNNKQSVSPEFNNNGILPIPNQIQNEIFVESDSDSSVSTIQRSKQSSGQIRKPKILGSDLSQNFYSSISSNQENLFSLTKAKTIRKLPDIQVVEMQTPQHIQAKQTRLNSRGSLTPTSSPMQQFSQFNINYYLQHQLSGTYGHPRSSNSVNTNSNQSQRPSKTILELPANDMIFEHSSESEQGTSKKSESISGYSKTKQTPSRINEYSVSSSDNADTMHSPMRLKIQNYLEKQSQNSNSSNQELDKSLKSDSLTTIKQSLVEETDSQILLSEDYTPTMADKNIGDQEENQFNDWNPQKPKNHQN